MNNYLKIAVFMAISTPLLGMVYAAFMAPFFQRFASEHGLAFSQGFSLYVSPIMVYVYIMGYLAYKGAKR